MIIILDYYYDIYFIIKGVPKIQIHSIFQFGCISTFDYPIFKRKYCVSLTNNIPVG